ncbi:helix-turn-helix domain-containing protein [Pseudonocardia bannensis]|uniref:Helix-turn-helix domain-containing protein n=1 Tax=Pseudonocardia bannensis TaxID=630973 RepID=A0A848DNS6_9PSEU|nr:helix-turn-helix domain-containing protein [Pseudonocardia bannensis]NMH94183.1 helix-turn-helix domain-containing protein [Pseudonocardia bannensis]
MRHRPLPVRLPAPGRTAANAFGRVGLQVAAEIGSVAATPGHTRTRAEAMLEPLRRIVPFDAIWMATLDPERREHTQLAARGYDDATLRYMAGPEMLVDIEAVGLDRSGRTVTVSDTPVPKEELRIWVDYYGPAGFVEGLGVGLFTADGRYLGLLAMMTGTKAHPTRGERELFAMLAPTVACAVDPMRMVATSARMVRHAHAGVVLTRDGALLPLPDMPRHPVVERGSAVLSVVTSYLAQGAAYVSFLCPHQVGHLRITALPCPPEPPYHLTAVVLVSTPPDLYGLTPCELDVLGLLVEGWPRGRIAAALRMAEFDVAARIETAAAKLGAPTGTLATVRAAREGLYVPRALIGLHPDPGLRDEPARDARSNPATVNRVVAAIQARHGRRWTLAELAEIAHLSPRRLQFEFQRGLATTPMRYLEGVRLARAHEELSRADPATSSVGRIAERNGFSHLGRFAASYREVYGVPPSQTLRRPR